MQEVGVESSPAREHQRSAYRSDTHLVLPTERTFQSPGWKYWEWSVHSYIRDFTVERSDYARESAERNLPDMKLRAFNGCAAILRRRVKFNELRHPIMRLYKCVDNETAEFMLEDESVPQQSDDQQVCVCTCTDLTLNQTLLEQFSDDETRFRIFIVDARLLLDDGWIPMYDRGYVYWYPPIEPEYIYGAPEFSVCHLPEECNEF